MNFGCRVWVGVLFFGVCGGFVVFGVGDRYNICLLLLLGCRVAFECLLVGWFCLLAFWGWFIWLVGLVC